MLCSVLSFEACFTAFDVRHALLQFTIHCSILSQKWYLGTIENFAAKLRPMVVLLLPAISLCYTTDVLVRSSNLAEKLVGEFESRVFVENQQGPKFIETLYRDIVARTALNHALHVPVTLEQNQKKGIDRAARYLVRRNLTMPTNCVSKENIGDIICSFLTLLCSPYMTWMDESTTLEKPFDGCGFDPYRRQVVFFFVHFNPFSFMSWSLQCMLASLEQYQSFSQDRR